MCEKIITDLKKLQVQVYLVVNFTFSASLWELLRDDPGNENGWLPGHYPVAKHKSLNFSYPCFYTPGPPVMPHPVVMTMTLVLKRDLQVTWVTSPQLQLQVIRQLLRRQTLRRHRAQRCGQKAAEKREEETPGATTAQSLDQSLINRHK